MSLEESVKKTIILPRTNFPIKRSKNKDEEIISSWESYEIYKKSLLDKENGDFVVHDGPPYANGPVHIGHFVNRVLKDFSLRFHNSIGFRTEFKLAWDTYGLPIEFKVLKENKGVIREPLETREKCRQYAFNNIELQKSQLKKIGLLTNYNDYYSTQDFGYQANEIRVLGEVLKKGLVYKSLKPVYWSWSNQTALAENEVEYFEKEDYSLFFKVTVENKFFNFEKVNFIVWTTQPWTIPFNKFIAVNAEENYSLVKRENELIVVSENFTKNNEYFKNNFSVEKTFKGREILGFEYNSIYTENSKKNYLIDGKSYVDTSSGTGIVHIAPLCGPEDFEFAKKEGLSIINNSLDEKGKIRNDFFVESLRGVFYQKASSLILEDLYKKCQIFDERKIIHSYPHDWRDKTPLVYRTTEQWFIKLSSLKENIKNNIKKVSWIPEHSREKMTSFIEKRDEWCISRQRSWGLPIPSIRIDGKDSLFPEIIDYVAKKIEDEGSDFWFNKDFKEELKLNFQFLLGEEFELGKDTLDVWFDSGVLAFSGKVKNWKADLYLEGKDQFRGWFNSSLIISTIVMKDAPYRKVVSHGFVVDENGKKMSKSLNNAVDVDKVINEVGIDVLRLWVLSFDFSKEMKIGENVILKVKNSYQKMRNTLRFMIGNLTSSYKFIEDLNVQNQRIEWKFSELNNYILSKTWSLALQSKECFFNYKFSNLYSLLNNYFTNDLSAFYFDVIKDSLYCDDLNEISRKEIVLVIYSILQVVLKIISSITPVLAEEAYKEIEIKNDNFFGKESIHLVEFPKFISFGNSEMKKREINFEKYVINLRKNVFQEVEKMRKENYLEYSSHSKVSIYIEDENQYNYLNSLKELKQIFMVAEIFIIKSENFSVKIEKSSNKKCERCWRIEIAAENNSSYCERCLNNKKCWKI